MGFLSNEFSAITSLSVLSTPFSPLYGSHFVHIGNLDGTPLEAVFILFCVPQARSSQLAYLEVH